MLKAVVAVDRSSRCSSGFVPWVPVAVAGVTRR